MIPSRMYFEDLYRHNSDPWGYDSHWYEARKRQICLALLTRPRYPKVLEVGCSNGHLSFHLAQRAEQLWCIDVSECAVQLASERLQEFEHVIVENRKIPEDYSIQKFDLILISEMAYYLSANELHQFIEKLKHSLNDDGEILCCHWRHEIQGFELNAEQVHQTFQQHFPFHHYLSLNDPDFMIDVWTANTSSLAQQEKLR
ncbi:methyltransferase domain protein [Acinetobacter calcoaceticus RUH2202]|uniref:class I SAM-dependent methyltransferase n=1 Tax=Acinetobacter calcoaceticus TaxID=471 RepID=UPI0001BB4BC7|nr:SAM-dependent methyltransferase [Acinetobacter calcoaceticus]EEY77582.1 methyltransferase domain protein [Acinetobacter calcoaceticus RUH2202]